MQEMVFYFRNGADRLCAHGNVSDACLGKRRFRIPRPGVGGDIALVPVLLAGEQGRMRTLKVQSPPSQAAFFQTLLFYYMVGKFSVN